MNTTNTSVKLNNHNFRDWRTYLQDRLMAKGLYQTLTPTTSNVVSDEENQKAYGILIETLETEQYRHIDGIAAVDIAFKALRSYHEPITKADRIEVLQEWTLINWNPKRADLPDFIHRFEVLTRRLKDVGITETDENLVAKLLALMPWSLRHIVDRLLHTANQSVDTIKVALETEWKAAIRNGVMSKNGTMSSDERALSADGGRGARQGRGQDRGRGQARGHGAGRQNGGTKKGKCHYCGKEGHWKSECRKKAADEVKKSQERSNQAIDEDFMFSVHEMDYDTTKCEVGEGGASQQLRHQNNNGQDMEHQVQQHEGMEPK
ncbi:hypothetical protein LEN26_012104 [Aphanomyces euteiches]|nr:hypothetical protein LEN26_012104 [Aphanomyces euteiches]